jgi:competence protein ComEC
MVSLSDVTFVVNQLLPEPHAGLLNGILFGTKAQLTPELKNALIRTGTLHIVALSGMNITIIANLVASTLLRLFSRRITSLLTILIIMGFVWFVGSSPSVIRAALMGCLSLLSTVFGKQKGAFWLLICAAAIMLISNVSYLFNLSFQLSFGATLGIILFGSNKTSSQNLHSVIPNPDVHRDKLREDSWGMPDSAETSSEILRFAQNDRRRPFSLVCFLWNLIRDDLKTTLAAQIFTTPLLIYTFHRLSLLSPVANLLIGWIIQPITVVGFLMCVCGLFWYPLAYVPAWIAWLLLQFVVGVIYVISAVPFASLEW